MSGVFVFSIIIGVLELLSFKNGGRGAERFGFAILLAFTVISPIKELIDSFEYKPSFPSADGGEITDAEYESYAREAIEKEVERLISEKFSLGEGAVRVSITDFSFKSMKGKGVRVILSLGAGRTDPSKVKKFVDGLSLGECEVSYEIG